MVAGVQFKMGTVPTLCCRFRAQKDRLFSINKKQQTLSVHIYIPLDYMVKTLHLTFSPCRRIRRILYYSKH